MILQHDNCRACSTGSSSGFVSRLPGLMLALLAIDLTLVLGQGCANLGATDSSVVPDQMIVSVKPGVTQGDLAGLLAGQDASIVGELQGLSAYLIGMDPSNREQPARPYLLHIRLPSPHVNAQSHLQRGAGDVLQVLQNERLVVGHRHGSCSGASSRILGITYGAAAGGIP